MKKLLSLLLTAALTLGLAVPAMAAERAPVVILHTNDVHTATDGYAAVAAYRQEMEAQYGTDRVTLVDTEGNVAFDNYAGAASMENHGDRE